MPTFIPQLLPKLDSLEVLNRRTGGDFLDRCITNILGLSSLGLQLGYHGEFIEAMLSRRANVVSSLRVEAQTMPEFLPLCPRARC